jgi:hypothetical protein
MELDLTQEELALIVLILRDKNDETLSDMVNNFRNFTQHEKDAYLELRMLEHKITQILKAL